MEEALHERVQILLLAGGLGRFVGAEHLGLIHIEK